MIIFNQTLFNFLIYKLKYIILYMENLTKKTVFSDSEVLLLREKFISDYSIKKGWNPKELTSTQMLEIATQPAYQSPGMLLS